QAITTVGLDIAKSVFQVHGVDAAGEVIIRRQPEAPACSAVLSEATSLRRWHGGLCHVASLVARDRGARAYRAADAARLCEALRQAAEERCRRCRGHL